MRAGKPDYKYKDIAISKVAAAIRGASGKAARGEVVIVPAPPSKPRGHPEYDDRIERVARRIGPQADVRCLLDTAVPREQAKRSDQRPSIDDLVASMTVNLAVLDPVPAGIILLDDVITNGTTFKAAQRLLTPHLQGRKLVGLFLARRVFAPIEWPEI